MKLGEAPERKIVAYETDISFIFPIKKGSVLRRPGSPYTAVEIFKDGREATGAHWKEPRGCIRTIYEGDEF